MFLVAFVPKEHGRNIGSASRTQERSSLVSVRLGSADIVGNVEGKESLCGSLELIHCCYSLQYSAFNLGPVLGQQCIAVIENPGVDNEPSSVQNNTGAIESTENDVDKIQKVQTKEGDGSQETTPRSVYVGFRNAAVYDRQAPTNLFLRNIRLSCLPADLSLDSVKPQPVIILGEEDASNLPALEQETIQLLQKYREACVKQQQRAEKFGTEYVPPKLSDTMPYSDLRRMRANPTGSVLNGMDLQSPEEKEKLEKRKNRFGAVPTPEASTTVVNSDIVPSDQAWDKMGLVGEQRMDPPPELWLEPVADDSTAQDEFRMSVDPPRLVHEKIHLFSIDWAAFKQIRTSDLERHFGDYAPTYVEWLSDLSCNIHFADKFAACRAITGLSQELPRGKTPDLHAMGWRMGTSMVKKVINDRYGRKGTRARLLMRVATSVDILVERPSSWKTPPGQFSAEKVLGPESDMPPPKKPKVRKRDRKRKQNSEQRTTEEMLNGGLSAGRAGFSAADLESERSTKKTKV